jgi:hypothetical protein
VACLLKKVADRFRELVLSVYLYNEWRGYRQLEDDLIPNLEGRPEFAGEFLAGVRKHAADERKHYRMFQGWFAERGRMPYAVGPSVAYFDTLASWLVGRSKQPDQMLAPERFARLCRAVVTTERRGIQQLDAMLRWRTVREDARLKRVLEVIRVDEPSHYGPYEKWLEANGHRGPRLREKLVDFCVHYGIAVLVLPALFFNPRLKRLTAYAQ